MSTMAFVWASKLFCTEMHLPGDFKYLFLISSATQLYFGWFLFRTRAKTLNSGAPVEKYSYLLLAFLQL